MFISVHILYFLLIKLVHCYYSIELRHINDHLFEVIIPRDVKFSKVYVYNNPTNTINSAYLKKFEIERLYKSENEESFTFEFPYKSNPNLYYGVCFTDKKGNEYFSNRFYLAKNGSFYREKNDAPEEKRPSIKEKFKFNWFIISLIVLGVLGSIALSLLAYILIQKYRKRSSHVVETEEITEIDQRPVKFE